MSRAIHTRTAALILVAVCLLAGGLRFHNLTDRGIFDYDEAWFLLEAKTLYDTGRFAWLNASGASDLPNLRDFLKERGTVPITSGKPGHTLFVLLGILLLGVHDYASFVVSALLGTLTVFLIYKLSARIYGAKIGLLSGLIFALSPLHVGYSRSGYVQATALFFVTLGLYLWFTAQNNPRPVTIRRFAAGCAIGYAFTCHFNLFVMPPLFIAWEIYATAASRSRSYSVTDWMKRLGVLGAGMLTPLLCFELPARLLKALGQLPDGQQTYFEQLLYRSGRNTYITLGKIPGIFEKLTDSEGMLIAAGIFIGAWLLVRRDRKTENTILLSFLLIPAIPWSLLSVDGHPPLFRNFVVLGIPAAILAAVGLARAGQMLGQRLPPIRPLVFSFLSILVLANGIWHVHGLLPIQSAYREATDKWLNYVRQHGGDISFFPGSVWPIWYFYLSAGYEALPDEVRQHVRFYPGQKDAMPPQGNFDALDIKRYYRSLSNGQPELLAYFSRIRHNHRPVIRVRNPVADLPMAYSEVGGQKEREIRETLSEIAASGYIEIYDLRRHHAHHPGKASVLSQANVTER